MNNEKKIIRFENVALHYGDEEILDDFSLEITQGEFLTVIGSSGCGKTTMLKLINGLLKPQAGRVLVYDQDIAETDRIALRRKIGYVVQEIGLFPHMSIEKNITYVPDLRGKGDKQKMKNRVDKMMELMELPLSMKKRYPAELSGGQRQRVGIARALMGKPDILLMDEPFGAVDEITRKKLQQEIQKIHRDLGVTIVFVTHDIREAMLLGSKVLVMDKGKIEQYDEPEQLRSCPATEFVKNLVVQ